MTSGLGSFSGGGLGMGVAFKLNDYFNGPKKDIERGMQGLSASTDIMANKITKSLNKVKAGASIAFAGLVILSPFIAGVENASQLEENINKVDVAFKEYAASVIDFSKSSASNYGLDQITALDVAALFGDMGTAMGQTESQASTMSKSLVGLVGDLASFKNIGFDQARNALKGIYTGETESLKNLGIVMTKSVLTQFAMDQGITKTMKSMTQAEKVALRYAYVMQVTANAQGDYIRTSDGYANSQRTFKSVLREVSASLGSVLLPLLSKMFGLMTGILKAFKAFADSKFGQVILTLAAAIGVLLTVMGVTMIVTNGLKWAVVKLTLAYGGATGATIAHAIASGRTAIALRLMGRAAWASIGPYAIIAGAIMLIVSVVRKMVKIVQTASEQMVQFMTVILFMLGPIGWLIWLVGGIRRGMSNLSKDLKDIQTTGVIGFFNKLAGVAKAISEIWNSWNGETFTITEVLAQKLEKLGIYDFVVSLGTWVIRIKEFFKGIWEGMREAFGVIKDVLVGVWDVVSNIFSPIGDLFDKMGWSIGKTTSDLEKWRKAGKIAGYIIVGILVLITAVFVVLGVVALIVLAAIILIIGIVVLVLWGIYEVIMWIYNGFVTAFESIKAGWDNLKQKISNFYDWIKDTPNRVYQVGKDFVSNLWSGIKSMWTSMVDWISDKVTALFDKIKAPFQWVGNKIGAAWDWVAGNDDEDGGDGDPVGPGKTPNPINNAVSRFALHPTVTSKSPTIINNIPQTSGGTSGDIHVTLTMDGDEVAKKVIDKTELDKNRD